MSAASSPASSPSLSRSTPRTQEVPKESSSSSRALSPVRTAFVQITLEEGQAQKETRLPQAAIITQPTPLQATIDAQAAEILLLKRQVGSLEKKSREVSIHLHNQIKTLESQISSLYATQNELISLHKQQVKTLINELTALSTNFEELRFTYNNHVHNFHYYGIAARTQGGTEPPYPQSNPNT